MQGPAEQQREGVQQKSLYPADKYSLYSTDTEERIISVDKGLERCAAMLRSLEDNSGNGVAQGGGKKPDSKEKPLFAMRKAKVLTNRKGFKEDKRLPKSSDVRKQPRSGSVSNTAKQLQGPHPHLTHPTACSTPDNKHQGVDGQGRSKSKAGPRNMKEKRSSSTPPPSVPVGTGERELVHCAYAGSVEDLQLNHPLTDRKNVKPRRRLRTEPGKLASLANLRNGGTFKPAVGTQGRGHVKSATERTKKPAGNATPTTHLPPPPPPLFHPYYHPYGFPYLPPYPFPYYPQFLAPEWTQEAAEYPPAPFGHPRTQTEALDLATLHHRHPFHYPRGYPMDYYSHHGYYTDLHKLRERGKPRVTADRATPATGGDVDCAQASEKAHENADNVFVPMPAANQNQVLDVESLDILLCELLNSCEEQVQGIRAECGSLLVGGKLDEVQGALRQCRQQLHQQCRRLAVVQKQAKLSEPSVADWLSQIQQVEQERAGVIERLKESCAAYSEVSRTLDDLEKLKKEQDRELEEKKRQISELQRKLDSVTTDFGETVATLKMTTEELASVRKLNQSSTDLETKLKDKNATLQQQVHSLLENVTLVNREKVQLVEQLSHTKQSLEAGKEEQQMLKAALSEKNTQLLQAEDQLLGFRQCLAYFVSEVSKSSPTEQRGSGKPLYSITVSTVNKLKDLANNGNIERFLATYSESTGKGSSLDFREGSPQSISSATVTGDEEGAPLSTRTELSTQINVITPLYSSPSTSLSSSPSSSLVHLPTLLNQDSSLVKAEGHSSGNDLHVPGQRRSPEDQRGVAGYQFYPVPSCSSVATDVKSSMTTASEVDFRNNLASLDADIARLQMQFKVALQSPK